MILPSQERDTSSDFLADGSARLLDGIEADARSEIERKHAAEWNASGIFRRWILLRRMEREIADLVAERTAHVSPDSLF